ncbi:short-chain dehydrogenase/reductase SDR [Dacryopinax primogenitus]|uniref:Short-chain dehydrogenase/reductase SDR n=1 Tax=Dacryopinax primogenitus (strain DJM 731) TaxID=1858805 RepID=M5GEL6_DACPD|nr:short-chain dehydrogenase/reductase SDR [Dacryopinax primogenitus]EJU03373.1 short-chain dehydrogenase/reductase SDR [Dacryopinax primogenitus]
MAGRATAATGSAPAKVALITGASSGIGKVSAIALAKAGWSVVLAARRREELYEAASDCQKYGGQVLALVCDIAQEEEVKNLFAAIAQQFGRLDVLFNNAGTGAPPLPIEDLTLAQFQQVINVNLTGAWLCTQEAVRMMKGQVPRGGRIINNGSISAYAPRPNSSPYTMSKHAILGLTKCTSLDGRKYNIVCTQIDIGNADTSLGGRMQYGVPQADGSVKSENVYDPRHVADAVVYISNLPLNVTVLTMNIMASDMPFVGRG